MIGAYKKAMHRFFLKVHPDFFSRNKQWQRSNEIAVAQLNELLEWGKSFKSGQLRPPPAPRLTLTFRLKVEEDGSGGANISSTFEAPKNLQLTESAKGPCERAINKFLRQLLTQSGCLNNTVESLSMAQDEIQEKLEVIKKPLRRRVTTKGNEKGDRRNTLMDEASASLAETWYPEVHPSIDDLIEADMILFAVELTPQQSAYALRCLRENLSSMRYNLWYSIPLLFSHKSTYGVGTDIPATLTIPWNFECDKFLQFLLEHVQELQNQKQEIESVALVIEQCITNICTNCDLDDVIISCSNRDAVSALRVLESNVGMLQAVGLTRTSVEISNIFGFRKNGVVVLPMNITVQSLATFLEKAQKADWFRTCTQTYHTTKTMIEETMWHLREFRTSVRPSGIDPNFDSAFTYAQRLHWSRSLVDISARLAQWDWSEFTFVLETLDIDWVKKCIMLPWNFDGPAFLRYVEEIHNTARERHRDSLVEEENKQKSAAHLERIAPLLQDMDNHSNNEEEVDATNNTHRSSDTASHSVAHPHQRSQASSLSPGTVCIAGEPIAPDVAQSYMMSHVEDNLHVESPLTPRTSFISDMDAKEQLEWEGFYQNPMHLGKEAMADEEDKERAFWLLNRTTRERLARAMTEESASMRESRKIKFRLADVTGIRDPRKRMERAFKTSRGTRVPENET